MASVCQKKKCGALIFALVVFGLMIACLRKKSARNAVFFVTASLCQKKKQAALTFALAVFGLMIASTFITMKAGVPVASGWKLANRFSVTGPQAALLFEIAVKTAEVCPAADVAPGSSFGITKEQAQWYESAHDKGVQQADEADDGVSDTAVGNGWEYGDDDILGMVAPLALELRDSVLDVGCGDGFFLERMLRVLPQLQVGVSLSCIRLLIRLCCFPDICFWLVRP
jgi:hypothetical protein